MPQLISDGFSDRIDYHETLRRPAAAARLTAKVCVGGSLTWSAGLREYGRAGPVISHGALAACCA
jgi:hypothetical protein